MSIIFGIQAAAEQRVAEGKLRELARATERFAPDGTYVIARANVGMGYQPYYTHERSHLETQPTVDELGSLICFDGRLDNHQELRSTLGLERENAADSEIVLRAFQRWGENCFAHFIGDWALALWSSAERALYLARDHAGTRTLYYENKQGRVLWATYLETFLAGNQRCAVDDAYFACYLAAQPTHDLTPYTGIRAVTPGRWLRIQGDRINRNSHWSWMAPDQIRYRTDAEYEEHFFFLFKQAVGRRVGPGAPILAHLSGGMDSSSIVCMSDHIRTQDGTKAADLLDTVSYYDDSEPDWNERPYFESVENRRAKRGIHVSLPLLSEDIEPAPVRYLWPGADRATYDNERRLIAEMGQRDYRVVLSGIGGDELLGGFPTPLPELADVLAQGDIFGYFRKALAWCLVDRIPLLHMTGRAFKFLVQQYLPPQAAKESLPPWSTPRLKRGVRRVDHASIQDLKLFSRPSSMANVRMVPALLETLPHRFPNHCVRFEWRYPYLDRDLLEFLLRVPSNVLVRPGRRRAMMRNALRSIVPNEILERRRKGARGRSVPLTLKRQEHKIRNLFENLLPPLSQLADQPTLLRDALDVVHRSDLSRMHFVVRAIFVQLWSQDIDRHLAADEESLVT